MEKSSNVEELPKAYFFDTWEMRRWRGCWLRPVILHPAAAFHTSFEARDDDVFLASFVKTGTTWLKALSFCIVQRHNKETLNRLALESPHSLVPTVEAVAFFANPMKEEPCSDAPRFLHTHLPHSILPDSVANSSVKIVYIARNPKDAVISSWHFYNSLMKKDEEPIPLGEFVDVFCSGVDLYGPFVEHVAGYWEESKKRPEKILFLKYEELKADPKSQVLKIAEFLGKPFGDDDDDEGEVDEIVRRCSFEGLKNLEVNKSGSHYNVTPNSTFFRKGEVGDSKNYLTPEMEAKIDRTIRLKLEAIGLYF